MRANAWGEMGKELKKKVKCDVRIVCPRFIGFIPGHMHRMMTCPAGHGTLNTAVQRINVFERIIG
jgi:hypothetical protein